MTNDLKLEISEDPEFFTQNSAWWNTQPGPIESPFLRSEWFDTWARSRLDEGQKTHVAVAMRGGQPVAAAPLLKFGMRVRSMSDGSSDVFDVVGSDPGGVETVVSGLARETRLILDRVPADSPIATAVATSSGRWVVQRSLESPYVGIPTSVEELQESWSTSLKRNLRRGQRGLEAMGEVEFSSTTPGSELDSVLSEAFRLEAAGWKGDAGSAVMSKPLLRRFFEDFAVVADEKNWLRLSTLRVSGRLIGFRYDVEYAGRIFGILTSYDETLDPRSSVGSVLFALILEHAAKNGVQTYELGGHRSNEWKMMWTDKVRHRVDITGFGSGPVGRTARLAAGAVHLVRHS